jgi:hypothetical protein
MKPEGNEPFWLANRLLDLAMAIVPEEVRAEKERLRRLRG